MLLLHYFSDVLSSKKAHLVENLHVDNSGRDRGYLYSNILNETRNMLTDFYAPFNEKLAKMTGNTDFLKWNHKLKHEILYKPP